MSMIGREEAVEPEDPRGRSATEPSDIPVKGWKDIAFRVKDSISDTHLSIIGAGVAFFLLLGIIPALGAALLIYGYFADPQQIQSIFDSTGRVLPADVRDLISSQLQEISSAERASGLGAVVSLALALWAGSRGTKGMVEGLNIAYRERERRGFIKKMFIRVALTLILIGMGILALLLIAALPALLALLPLSSLQETLASWLRWPILLISFTAVLAILYRFAPSRRKPQWAWVSVGSVLVTVAWLIASAGFSFYVSNFGSYNETYGSLGAAVILLMWLYITSMLVLLGGVINAEMEHQTGYDTTVGRPKPIGRRGAYVADTLGDARD